MYLIDKLYFIFIDVLHFLKWTHLDKLPGAVGGAYKFFSFVANIAYLFRYKKVNVSDIIDEKTIVSLTSYGERAKNCYKTVDTLLAQSVRPQKVILWLAETEFSLENLPEELIVRSENFSFFEVRFCEDLKSHKKYYETLKQYPRYNMVIADDDVFYPKNWLQSLLEMNKVYPSAIACHVAHKIKIKDGCILTYDEWERKTKEEGPSLYLCPVGVGGVLYPPGSLDKCVFNKSEIIKLCIGADDLWLKVMGVLRGTKVVHSNKFEYTFLGINGADKNALSKNNVINKRNDAQLQSILTVYGSQFISKIKE